VVQAYPSPCGLSVCVTVCKMNVASGRVPTLLNPGDLLVFDGDVSHAGASYALPNTRVHVYLDVPGLKREAGVVWFKRIRHRV
jgi:ectoine hydroxylase-related dioxygenase (phytanoyl-CoA dioxygenase family)